MRQAQWATVPLGLGMMRTLLIICSVVGLTLVVWWMVVQASSSSSVAGLVYVDRNGNGQRDEGEAGLADVAVSNGREVVLSDARGHYRLNAEGANFIFVIKPAGYKLPLDTLARPKFFHALTGTPAPSHDFSLLKAAEASENFSVLVLADPQPYNDKQLEYFRRSIVADVENPQSFRFGLTLGDIVGDVPSLLEPMAEATATLGLPWWYVLGNHDLDPEASSAEDARGPFRQLFGPTHYAFNEGKVHFIVLDSVAWEGPGAGDFAGGLDPQQLQFVRASLKHVPSDHLVVLAMHIPPLGNVIFKGMFRSVDRAQLFEALGRHRVLTLAGHTHTQLRIDMNEAFGWQHTQAHHLYVVGAASGDGWRGALDARGIPHATMRDGTPHGYGWIEFRGSDYQLNWKAAGKPQSQRLHVHGPSTSQAGEQVDLHVNVYTGYYSAQRIGTPVEYRLPEGEWQAMVPSLQADPYRLALEYPWARAHWQEVAAPPGRRPKASLPSLHLWTARLPADLAPGLQQIDIRVRDSDGRVFHAEHQIRVVQPLTRPR